VSREVVPFKMPLKGEHAVPLQVPYSVARIGLPSPLTRAAGHAASRPGRGPRQAGAEATPPSPQVGGTHLVDSLGVELGHARPSVPSTSFRSEHVKPPHEARPDEATCDSPSPLEHERQASSRSEIDHWVQYGRVIERRDRIAASASDAPAMSAVAADGAVGRCATKMEDTRPGGPAPAMTIDLEQLSNNLVHLIEQGCKAVAACLKPEDGRLDEDTAGEIIGVARTFSHVAEYWLTHPDRAIQLQTHFGKAYFDLWLSATKRMLVAQPEPVAGSESEDRRFIDPAWSSNPFADIVKRAYLLTSQWASRLVKEANGVDAHTRRKAEFYVRQFTGALSPANFVLTNPELLRETMRSNAGNLVAGMRMLAEDIKEGGGHLKIRHSDTTAFAVGRNLAITPGRVIYQNDLMQLIQYAPTTCAVLKRPILIIPPWINKYYILDLVPEKSFVKWCVDRGLTVFVISWVNPDAKLASKGFDDYMREGPLAALAAVATATGEEKVHTVGYCAGGTLLAATMAYMAAKGDDRALSATLFATQVDFTHAGDIHAFIDEDQIRSLERRMSKTGFLDGNDMATAFNLLRSNDLIWSPIIRHYLKGEPPRSLDFLSWNSDTTRIPAACHSFYLRSCYLDNKLAKGEMVLAGEKIDLGNVTTPIYSLAAREDHIAPAKSVFVGSKLFGGQVMFVVAGSGHIAGVINPPYQVKYSHWIDGPFVSNIETWLAKAEERPGSWWPHWLQWIREHDPTEVSSRTPGGSKFKAFEGAPGSYVKVRT
jgi:polyhydroxyalkanoate synthase subunit PhaC